MLSIATADMLPDPLSMRCAGLRWEAPLVLSRGRLLAPLARCGHRTLHPTMKCYGASQASSVAGLTELRGGRALREAETPSMGAEGMGGLVDDGHA